MNMNTNMNSLYSLTWGDYSASLVNSIQLLRCHNDLVDCTLAAGGRVFPAHKIVLCAASPLLLDLLKNTPCKHPVVMLAGVNPTDLEALLEFVYRGEVSVDHSQLPSLLQAAHCLNIQGLAPQTISKEDYANTQYQLPLMQQHTDAELITTLNAPQQQQQQVHTQIIENITAEHTMTPTNTLNQQQTQPSSMKSELKDTVNQFLPARKRKPRNKSKSPIFLSESSPKMSRTDGLENIISSPTTPQPLDSSQLSHHTINTGSTENGDGMNNIKSEIILPDNAISIDDISTPTTQNTTTSTPIKSGRQSRQRSQSEQPATCPICYAVIRQSRNLRRHLELRHFAKPGVKKERKAGGKKLNLDSSANTSTSQTNVSTVATSNSVVPQVQTVQTLHPMQTVQVKKDPDGSMSSVGCSSATSSTVTPVTVVTATHQQHSQHVQQSQHHQGQQQTSTTIVDQTGHVIATTQGQQILTQNENADGTLSIAQVQTLQGHPITLGNLNQVNMTEYQPHQHH